MDIFTIKCPSCQNRNPRANKYCTRCGTALRGARFVCGLCGTENAGDAANCRECGRPLAAYSAVDIQDRSWARGPGDFAARLEAADLPGVFRKGIRVEMGTNAILVENGVAQGELGPGQYTLDSLEQRLIDWLTGAGPRNITVLLTDIMPAELEFHCGGIFTKDPLRIGASVQVQTKVVQPGRFLSQVLRDRTRYSKEDLRQYLYPEVARTFETWVGQHTAQELAEDVRLKEKLELALDEALKPTFAQLGLAFERTRTAELNLEPLEEVKGIKSKYALLTTKAQAEAVGLKTYADAARELDLQKLAQDTAKVEDDEKRVELSRRIRAAVAAGKMDEVRSSDEFDAFIDGIDRQKLIRGKERADLLRTWQEQGEEHALARQFVLLRLKVEEDFQTKKAGLSAQGTLDQMALDNELGLARKRADFEAEQKQRLIQEQFAVERERQRIEAEKAEAEIRIARLRAKEELASDAERAKLGLELLAEMDRIELLRMESEKRIARIDEIERARATLDNELKRMDAEERSRQAAREHAIKWAQTLTNLGADALIAVSDSAQSKNLANKGMTPEQILAAAAGDSPEVARLLADRLQKDRDNQKDQDNQKLRERLIEVSREELARANETWMKSTEREKDTMKHAMDRLAEVAQSFARGQGAVPVVVSDAGGVRMVSAGASPPGGAAQAGTKTCPKCGRYIALEFLHCPHCGNKFEGMK